MSSANRGKLYVLDTSALADMLERVYHMIPGVQRLLDDLAANNRLIVPTDVHIELGSSAVANWAKSKDIVREIDVDVQSALKTVMGGIGRRMINPKETKNAADPIVIAFAKAFDGVVVSSEKSNPQSALVKIPDACAQLDVLCWSTQRFLSYHKHLL